MEKRSILKPKKYLDIQGDHIKYWFTFTGHRAYRIFCP